ncbi:hypothetical protein BASA81_009057 [Batrachochytrium salamandrivorans]|nr:hypothetical protein BASA81_009057 [Batrachochytrium salamandrivorans]
MDKELDSAVLQALLGHLREHPEIQNIALMNAGGFCRNCLAKWRHRAARQLGVANGATYEDSLQYVYGMSYDEYKQKFQQKATAAELDAFTGLQDRHAKHEGFDPSPVSTSSFHSSACCQDVQEEPKVIAAGPATAVSGRAISIGVLVLSDRASNRVYEDQSGPAILQAITQFATFPANVGELVVLPDDEHEIARVLREWSTKYQVIITCGGTGVGQRDVTPQATKQVIDCELVGVAEMLRRESALHQEPVMAWLSRAVCGTVQNRSLIVNLPGHPNAAQFCTQRLLPLLPRITSQFKE